MQNFYFYFQLTALVENAVALLEEGQQEDQPEGTVPPIIQARRRRYLAGTPRPLTPLIEGVADDFVNLVDPFEPTATPAAPTEQSGLLNITGTDILDESDNHPAPTVRGHLGRRLPASLSPGGDFIVPASRRPRLNRNAATTRQSTRGRRWVRGRGRGRGRGLGKRAGSNVRCRAEPLSAVCSKVNPRNTVCYPCGFFLCSDCSSTIRDGDGICPHCNEHAEKSVTLVM